MSSNAMNSTEPKSQLRTDLPAVPIKYVPLPSPLQAPATEPITTVATESVHLPCRRCLRDASPGEALHLLAYDPFPADSTLPYRGKGPIFVHADECPTFDGNTLPEGQLGRSMALRAYDEKHMMLAAETVNGEQLQSVAGGMLADGRASFVNVYNAKPGCFALQVQRA